MRRNDEVRGGGKSVPVRCYLLDRPLVEEYLPADSVFCHLPLRALGPVPQISGLNNVLLEWPRDLPLVVVVRGRGRREVATRQYLAGICEDLRSPPLEFPVPGRGKTPDERLAC